MSVPSTRFLAIRWSSMQTALSERENAQRTGGSGNRLIPDEGSDHIGYSAEFADAPGSELPNTPTHAETGVPADAFNPFNPFDQIISGGTRARLAEFGNRLFDNETDAWLSTLGIKGDKLFDGSLGGTTPGSATVRSRILRLGHKCPPRGSTAS